MYATAVILTGLLAASHALESPLLNNLNKHIRERTALGDVDVARVETKLLRVRSELAQRTPKGGKSGGSSSVGGGSNGGDDSSSSDSGGGGGSCSSSAPSGFSSTNCLASEKICGDGCAPSDATCCTASDIAVYCQSDERCVLSTFVSGFYKCCPESNSSCSGDDFNTTYTEIANFRFGNSLGGGCASEAGHTMQISLVAAGFMAAMGILIS